MPHCPARAAFLAPLVLLMGCETAPLPDAPAPGDDVALILNEASQRVSVTDPSPTVVTIWDRAFQEAIIARGGGPTVTARAAAILHTAMYDVWASYDPVAIGTRVGDAFQRPADEADLAAEAMSYAAHALLSGMFPGERARFDRVMRSLGYRPDPHALSGNPAGLGRVIAGRVATHFGRDGSNWDDGFEDDTGYEPANPSPFEIADVARWTPEATPIDPESRDPDQDFLTPQWGRLTPFSIGSARALRPAPPEPFFAPGIEGRVDVEARTITLADGRTQPVTPDLIGPVVNPGFIAQAERVVRASAALTDRQKMIAEFWEDNKDTSFPPGTWLVFGQYVSARDDHSLGEDATMFLAIANALQDAAIATWEAKRHYDYARPVRAIRTLGRLGLIGEPGTDQRTGETGHVIRAWGGPGRGTETILATRFLSYQNPEEDPSPPFAEYPSGHSGFSAAAAEVIAAFAGSDRFGGSVTFRAGASRFEPGLTPAAPVTLAWPTFSDAADEAGISRIYGGIHFDDGDRRGRALGRAIGRAVLEKVRGFASGTATDPAG